VVVTDKIFYVYRAAALFSPEADAFPATMPARVSHREHQLQRPLDGESMHVVRGNDLDIKRVQNGDRVRRN